MAGSHRAHMSQAEALAVLRSHDELVVTTLRAGQVILYEGHVAPGTWVLTSGAVIAQCEGTPTRLLPAADVPVVIPAPSRLGTPSRCTYEVARDAEGIHVPRALLAADEDVRHAVEDLA